VRFIGVSLLTLSLLVSRSEAKVP